MSASRLKLNMDRSSCSGLAQYTSRWAAVVQLGADIVAPSDDVWILSDDVIRSESLEALHRHQRCMLLPLASTLSSSTFARLSVELRRCARRPALTITTSCCPEHGVAGARKTVMNKLQRVLDAAARVISGLSAVGHAELHWLDVPERISYKLDVMAH